MQGKLRRTVITHSRARIRKSHTSSTRLVRSKLSRRHRDGESVEAPRKPRLRLRRHGIRLGQGHVREVSINVQASAAASEGAKSDSLREEQSATSGCANTTLSIRCIAELDLLV